MCDISSVLNVKPCFFPSVTGIGASEQRDTGQRRGALQANIQINADPQTCPRACSLLAAHTLIN